MLIISDVLINTWTILQVVGLKVISEALSRGPADAVFTVELDGVQFLLAFESMARAPYPNEIARLEPARERLSHLGVPTLMAPAITAGTGNALTDAGWSWVDGDTNANIRTPGVIIQRRVTDRTPAPSRDRLPSGSGSWAVIRDLIEGTVPDGIGNLATSARISQPRASQILRDLGELGFVERTGRSTWQVDRPVLLDAFLTEYPGPGGVTQWWYSLDPPTEVAERLRALDSDGLVSGDVAADRISPWNTPASTTFYASGHFDLSSTFVQADSAGDSNVRLTWPADTSLWRNCASSGGATDSMHLVRPTQIIWDLRDTGDDGRRDASDRIVEWLFR